MFYSAFKQLAFKFDPETIHDVIINSGDKLKHFAPLFSPLKPEPHHQLSHNELTWKFPVGLAAGFDKNAKAIGFFDALGFGAIEVGTITKEPQVGNPRPRIQRHPSIDSLQNSMGFPNMGALDIAENLHRTNKNNLCLGVNIGKNKDTSEAKTPLEYAYLYQKFAPMADYIAVNISSPNTPGLRQFQDREKLTPLLDALVEARSQVNKPCFLKISPDMQDEDIKTLCEHSKEKQFSGIIATNTTIQHSFGKGGLSGNFAKPMAKATRKKVCDYLREDPTQTIIGVGGINSYQEIKEFWQQGGHFTQIYTSFIYQGPELLKKIASEMEGDMRENQVSSIQALRDLHAKKVY